MADVLINTYDSTKFVVGYYQKLAVGKSTSMSHIVGDGFNNPLIPLPPLSEQKRIVAEMKSNWPKPNN